ncbi:MAG: hypothetical protein GKR95_16845 [Gammaproteobacteria bacterium]|nr:hypothetical protein [Gammaproteobacteria bacterium]
MPSAPDFTDTEIHQIRELLTRYYGRDVEIQLSRNHSILGANSPGSSINAASYHTVFWHENDVNFLILKSDLLEYRPRFFSNPHDQHNTGVETYNDLAKCVDAILTVQADHVNSPNNEH